MKFNAAQSMPNMAARQVTRRNQAWAIDKARLDLGNRRPLIMMVVDVHSRLPLSLTVEPVARELLDRVNPTGSWARQPTEEPVWEAFAGNDPLDT
jgi:hypothetical protein